MTYGHNNRNYPIVTAEQALQDCVHPGELFRAAWLNERMNKYELAGRIRGVARELAAMMDMRIYHRAPRNDNYKGKRERAGKRRAA